MAVRIAAARALGPCPRRLSRPAESCAGPRGRRADRRRGATAERPEAQLTIGAFVAARGQYAEAEAAYRAALRLDPTSAPVMVNLADLYRAQGRDSEAEPILRQAIALAPGYAPAHMRWDCCSSAAMTWRTPWWPFRRRSSWRPTIARYVYVYAIALNQHGHPQDALAILKQANARHPADTDILTALATISRDIGRQGRRCRLCRTARPRRAEQPAGGSSAPIPRRLVAVAAIGRLESRIGPRSNGARPGVEQHPSTALGRSLEPARWRTLLHWTYRIAVSAAALAMMGLMLCLLGSSKADARARPQAIGPPLVPASMGAHPGGGPRQGAGSKSSHGMELFRRALSRRSTSRIA